MRNYVIINGVNSLTIQGLAIKTLPPITKPIQRNLREEIDGRDGDIVTTLGYGAYDKTIEIGLFGTFDIDEVIAYFNQKGTITFSNEADKVYYFEALDQVDYAELLKFRTANVVLHCQPFKYPLNEAPLVEEYEYVEATGTNVTLDNTSEAIFNKIDLKGNTSQNGTPTPSSPIPINVVSGDNTIEITGKNLYITNQDTYSWKPGSAGWKFVDGTNGANGTNVVNTIYKAKVISGQTYTFTANITADSSIVSALVYDNENPIKRIDGTNVNFSETFTSSRDGYIILRFYVNANVSVNVNNVMLETGSQATTYEPYIGKSYPIDLGVVNLFDKSTANLKKGVATANGGLYNSDINFSTDYIEVKTNGTYYTASGVSSVANRIYGAQYDSNKQYVGAISTNVGDRTFYISNTNVKYIRLTGLLDEIDEYQVEEGQTIHSYSPYGTTPIELCKIGTYQDYIYKDNGVWYLHKEIGKVVLNGSENWSSLGGSGSNPYYVFYNNNTLVSNSIVNSTLYANYFITDYTSGLLQKDGGCRIAEYNSVNRVFFCIHSITSVNDFKTWLSTHNTIVYYVLATPTNTPIEDTTLIEQLEALRNAASYSGQTNVSQTNNDMPFILDISALKEDSDHLVINNAGNIYAKPTMDLEGTGVVDIYLNDVQILEADLTETNNIVIDTEAMEAYNPDTNALANRKVTGDYSKIKLEPGDNDLRFSGDLSKATITRYERWL